MLHPLSVSSLGRTPWSSIFFGRIRKHVGHLTSLASNTALRSTASDCFTWLRVLFEMHSSCLATSLSSATPSATPFVSVTFSTTFSFSSSIFSSTAENIPCASPLKKGCSSTSPMSCGRLLSS